MNQEIVRLVLSGQSIGQAAQTLGIPIGVVAVIVNSPLVQAQLGRHGH